MCAVKMINENYINSILKCRVYKINKTWPEIVTDKISLTFYNMMQVIF